MRASNEERPRYYGSMLNLEHRVMCTAVVVLGGIVMVLLG